MVVPGMGVLSGGTQPKPAHYNPFIHGGNHPRQRQGKNERVSASTGNLNQNKPEARETERSFTFASKK